ncbi:LysM peptidoglycan-binding domain-containing protein [Mesorhizobium sp. 1M-11]|uniref:LysM peptidoglycan-binding domain-containing protein n=1 Tax=Mesorhizobium sp. 1M-11 TaxID=1529006 RepID=UPI000B1DC884|nr:LysM peptidoglycan-binding domain-containing protein [Mesorhizobium sp. 1M-11]
MVRPIMPKLNPAPRVDPKANAAQIAHLEAQAAQLREQIRLANKMGEREWATTAHKELSEITGKLDALQQPTAAPVNGSVPANAGTPNNGGGIQPALYTPPATLTFAPVKLNTGTPDKDSATETTARSIADDVAKGKTIDKIATERGMKPEDVVAAINAGKTLEVTVTAPSSDNGNTQTTVIKDTSDPNNIKTTTSRDNRDTGAITTRSEEAGSPSNTERTLLPNGTTVETVTSKGGPSIPKVTVTASDGKKTVLDPSQRPGGSTTEGIQKDLADGKSVDQIAQDRHLSKEQVIAELQAAGYQVKNTEPPRGNGVQTVELDNPHTKEKTVYTHNRQSGERKVVTTKGDTETTVARDGNGNTTTINRNIKTNEKTEIVVDAKTGTEVKTVTDKDGRITKTTTEKLNGGKPIDYEVKPNDNLTIIAEAHGVTLDELRKTNPELFEKRNPNIINSGEKIRIENGTRVTVEVTANGYTLTTKPDGKITLHNNNTGANLDIKSGTAQEPLAALLLSINPESKDPKTAKADTVLKTTLEGILGGASPELLKDVADKQQAVKEAIKNYDGGKPGQPKLDGSTTTVGPFGDPPKEPTKSGGKWVPLMVDGNWQWFDPEVAKAIAAENAAVARLGEAQAKPVQSQAQLDVYALDPAYKEAMNSAKSTLDKALAPYGLEWKAPTPKGTLAQAQERLTLANDVLEKAATAKTEYAQAEKDLLAAISKQATLPAINDPKQPAAGNVGGPSNVEINLDAKAKHSEVSNLFIQSSLHTANGNKATVDQMVSATELELKLTDAKPGSPEHTAITERLNGLKTLQKAAGSQVTLAEAYAQYGVAQKEGANLAVRVEPIKQQIIAQARERNPHHFDEKGYTNAKGEFTGKLLKQEFKEENGQLYMVNTYENDNFLDENNNDTNVLKVQLTYDLNDGKIRDDFRNNSLNKQYQEVMSSTRSTPTSAPVCTPGGTGSVSALEAAKAKIIGTQVELLDAGLKDAKTKLVNADTALEKAIKEHGGGTIEAPAGTLKPGEQPVKITVNGRDIWVAPEVAAAYGKQGPSAIGDSGKAVQIEMNGQKLWVRPEVAAAEIDRGRAEDEKKQLEKWETESRPAMVVARDWYSFSAGHFKLFDDGGMAQRESKLKNEYFQEHRDKALAGYQVQFENLYDKGFTGEYKQYKADELTGAVAKTLGLDPSSEGVEKVTDEIHDRAGDDAQVKIVPIFSLDGGMESMTALFAIKDGGGKEVGYVDTSGKYYSSFDEFQHENRIFSDKGKLVMAKGGNMSLGADGKFTLDELEVADGRKVDFLDKATDIGLGIVAGAATIVSFIPGGQWAIPIALTSGAALGGKTLYKEGEHLLQGGEFDGQSAWNIATGVVSFLPVGAGSLRTIGLAKSSSSLSTFQAFKGGFGMTRMADASWGIGKFKVNVPQSSYAGEVSNFMQSGSRLNTAAWGLDAAGLTTGVPILMRSVEDLALHGGEMSFAELANAIVGIGTGAVGTGLGGRGLLNNMPGASGPRGGDGPSSGDIPPIDTPPPPPAGDSGSEPRPRHVYEAGSDGVYRPTGRYVMPSPDEIVIQGEVVSEKLGGSGTNFGTRNGPDGTPEGTNPTGPRALPAGHEQTTGGKSDPSGDGEAPVVTPARVAGSPVKGNAGKPSDSDPIIVPDKPVTGDDPVRLVWDPTTRTFTGMRERDTSGYVYTSGKDEGTPSAYLEKGPDGEVLKLTPEQLLARYEKEKSYYSSREMAERYGPDGVQVPRTPIREVLPDFRVGVTFRVRLNTGQAFDIGSPTLAAVGFGVGTKTDFGLIGWSVVDSFSQRSITPFKDALSTQGVVSYRAREYRNITALQAGVWPVSEQTALPVRAKDLSREASAGIFSDKAGYDAKPLDAVIVGKTPDGEGTVIELTYSPSLKGTKATLKPGQHDFFGVPAENKAGHVELEGALPFDRVMTETKAGLRLPIVANHVDAIDALPRVGVEMRPELPVKDTLQPGDVVSKQTYDQIQSSLGSTVLKVQFVVKDPAKAAEVVAAVGQGNGIRSIRDLVGAGQIDPSNTVLYADEPTISGLRLSAVPGKTPSTDIVLLTGEKVRVLNPEAMLVDVIFNDRNGLPGVLGTNPDKITTSLTYKVKSTVKSWLPARFQSDGAPQSRYMPNAGNIYKNLYGADGTPATRYTASLSTPPLPGGAFAYSAEVRVQFKSKAPTAARSIAKDETAQVTFKTSDGQSEGLSVPAWIARAVEPSRDGAATGIPKGGEKSLDQFLAQLETTARPDQLAAIAQFRSEFGSAIVDGGFMRQNVADGVMTLLSSQVGRRNSGPMQIRDENGHFVTATRFGPLPKSAESVYVPSADGPQARGDEPDLMHKSHIFFRDPETGEAYVLPWTRGASEDHVPGGTGKPDDGAIPAGEKAVEAAPVRKALEAAPPTTFSLQQIRNMRQPEKWKAGEVYTRELNGSLGEAHFPVQANPTGPHPVFGEGGRYVDAPVFKSKNDIEAIEVKTYHRWTTINGVAQMREVPLTPKLQEQINKDVALHNENPKYQPRWVFLDAPPSAELQGALDQAGIIGNIFGHNKPAAVKAPRTIALKDKDGEVIVAAMLGTDPRGPEQVYIPPSDGPRLAADAPETATKTHILVYDPDSGEPTVLPWIRGASEGHVPDGAPPPNPDEATPAQGPQAASNNGALTRDGVRAIPLDQVQNLNMGDFQSKQIPWLKREQVAEFTEPQFQDMDQAGLLPYLTKSQLRGIPKSKTGFVNIAGLDARQIPWVTKGQVSNMTGQQFVDLGTAGLTRYLIKPQVQAIKGDKIEFVDVSTLEGRQIPWFKPGQVAKFTSPQFEKLGEVGLLKHLGERQVQAVPETMVGSLDMTKFDPRQVPWLTDKQIPVLTRDQWGDFTIHHTEALTQPQIEAVTRKQFEEMSPGQFRKFTLEQFEWMGVDQTNGLSVLQLTTFRATHKKSMTADQRVLVDGALAYARTKEYQAALDTFGAMASTSYTLWSTLPPTWTATAGAVSFGVRGLVFGAQAVFPNATAAHKPFGRFLNALGGATFIAAAPGAATGVVQGKDLIVNSTFTLGNVVYGTKSMLQSFTGRPVIRNLAEYLAGPGYVLGCAVYTVNSWPAPIATVAGAMFTFGCAEFWASAIRTDRVNSRSVPRTDADIAAAEKSDKKWAAWDRWTLGITFGVGMLLFSIDALLGEPWKAAKPVPVPEPKKPDDKSGADGTQPNDGTDKPDPETKPDDFPQLVVLADDGLNLRTGPDGDSTVVTVLQPGTFIEQTDKPSTDGSGKVWLPVEGYGPDGKAHHGWVSADLVEPHPGGSSNPDGRTNPKLEQNGYRWVEVKNGDSIRLIATANSADVADTVVLNMDHILSPDVVFAGDRIYLPSVAVG